MTGLKAPAKELLHENAILEEVIDLGRMAWPSKCLTEGSDCCLSGCPMAPMESGSGCFLSFSLLVTAQRRTFAFDGVGLGHASIKVGDHGFFALDMVDHDVEQFIGMKGSSKDLERGAGGVNRHGGGSMFNAWGATAPTKNRTIVIMLNFSPYMHP